MKHHQKMEFLAHWRQ